MHLKNKSKHLMTHYKVLLEKFRKLLNVNSSQVYELRMCVMTSKNSKIQMDERKHFAFHKQNLK